MKKIAVILCGSGFKDGSEIRESVATLWALSSHPIEVECFAPNKNQHDVINCLTGEEVPNEKRNMLVEAARIARGKVKPLSELDPNQFSGVILPGGFGAAKNLCDFAFKGAAGSVIPELGKILTGFFESKKPIGAICIAPAIVALALKNKGLELTVGSHGEAAQEIEKLGHKHFETKAIDCHVDNKNRVVTTSAYMYDSAPLHEIFLGIKKLVDSVVKF